MIDGEDNSDAEREMLNRTLSAPRSTLSRRSKSVAKTYHEDHESDDEFATPGIDARAATPTPTPGDDMQPDFFAGGAFDGVHEATEDQMEGVGTLAPQGRVVRGSKLTGLDFKRVTKDDESDVSEFSPDM